MTVDEKKDSLIRYRLEQAKEAIELHVHGLQEDNQEIPESHSFTEYVAVL